MARNGNGHHDEHFSDGESDLVSIASDEFPAYFVERDDRLFHSLPTSPYPLPVDGLEQERSNVVHEVLKRMIGRHCVGTVGPLTETLAVEQDITKCVVDFCCGNGKWVLDMAAMFPDVSFIGLDIVPIATRLPPDNVNFEIHDISQQSRFPDNSIDIVHARFCSMAVHDYDHLVREASRILRPGGLFIFGENLRRAVYHPSVVGQDPRAEVPNFCAFYDILNDCLMRHGIQHVCDSVPLRLQSTGTFTAITPIAYDLPIGSWHEEEHYQLIGRYYRRALRRFMDSIRHFILSMGVLPEHYDNVCSQALEESQESHGRKLVTRYFTGFAVRS